jgi:hypothetical protein
MHHILPKSVFPEYENLKKFPWNSTILEYSDHISAHVLLLKAYPIKSFSSPLNYMKNMSVEEKEYYSKVVSDIAKQQWEDLKNNPEKFNEYRIKRSEWMTENMKHGALFHTKVCDGLNRYYENNNTRRKELSDFFNNHWNDMTEAEYNIRCKNMMWSDETRKKQLDMLSARYEDPVFIKKFKDKMKIVNSIEEKRKRASYVLKGKWGDNEWKTEVLIKRKLKKEERVKNGTFKTNSN